jgi:hypothetical protein
MRPLDWRKGSGCRPAARSRRLFSPEKAVWRSEEDNVASAAAIHFEIAKEIAAGLR